jgi:hypothetical protein
MQNAVATSPLGDLLLPAVQESRRMSDGLRIQQFKLELYPALAEFANAVHLPILFNRPFLEHYYLGQEWCRLFLAMDGSKCIGMIGVDVLHFVTQTSSIKAAFGTNFYSLQPGVGWILWLKCMKQAEIGLVFGGSQDTHRILRARKFDYYSGINVYRMNARFEAYEEDSAMKGMVKAGLRPWARKRLSEYASKSFLRRFADIRVIDRTDFSEEMVVRTSPFSFRFHPPLEYLRWRYNPRLDYVRYRIFQFLRSGQSIGFCVLNNGMNESMVVYADGNDPELLGAGILKTAFLAGEEGDKYRKVTLASSHPAMQALFVKEGFRLAQKNYPCAAGALGETKKLGDPRTWLLNFGMGDNDLRTHMLWPATTNQRDTTGTPS